MTEPNDMQQELPMDNTNVLMEGVQAAETNVASAAPAKSYSLPMLMFALMGLGFAGSHVWANRAGWQEVITGKSADTQCSTRQHSCCSMKSSEGGCCSSQQAVLATIDAGCCQNKTAEILAALESTEGCTSSGCPLANKDHVLAQQGGACCDKMKNALASALLEAHDKHNTQVASNPKAVTQVEVTSNITSEPAHNRIPAPPMPE